MIIIYGQIIWTRKGSIKCSTAPKDIGKLNKDDNKGSHSSPTVQLFLTLFTFVNFNFQILTKVMLLWPDFFLKLSMDPMVGNGCPIPIFSGLGDHGFSFSNFRQ